MKLVISLTAVVAACPALADNSRQLDAHEHGVGKLDIAIEGATVAMAFEAPGADIVGFEYSAESDSDLSAIDAAIATLSAPLTLFTLPDAANCSVVEAHAELELEAHHEEIEDEHHDEHSDEEHDTHEDGHHDEHSKDAGHAEFHAEYVLNCDHPDALDRITFAYFEAFPNAQEVEVQIITASGAQAFEVERSAPVLNLGR